MVFAYIYNIQTMTPNRYCALYIGEVHSVTWAKANEREKPPAVILIKEKIMIIFVHNFCTKAGI